MDRTCKYFPLVRPQAPDPFLMAPKVSKKTPFVPVGASGSVFDFPKVSIFAKQ
jgi:hypothetical protein